MRRVIAAVFILCVAASAPKEACAQFGAWQENSASTQGYATDFNDPSSAMRIRIEQVADRGTLGRRDKWAFSPCNVAEVRWGQGVCWSSYGRNLHMVLPKLAFNAVSMLMPHTIYSYQALDVRFPPALRIHLPYDATTTMGYSYDDELVGIRLNLNF